MKFRVGALLFFLFAFAAKGTAGAPLLFFTDSSLLKANAVLFGTQVDTTFLPQTELTSVALFLDYGINDRVTVNFQIPYNWFWMDPTGGGFGDLLGGIRIAIFESEGLTWRLLASFDGRIGTGPTEDDSLTRINNLVISYYPYSTGTMLLRPAVIGSFSMDNLAVDSYLAFDWENGPDGQSSYYRVEIGVSADYNFRLTPPSDTPVYLKPNLRIDGNIPLTDPDSIPLGIFATAQATLRWGNFWRLNIYTTAPFLTQSLYNLSCGIEFGLFL
jgi:hypothetical protein